MLEIATVGFSTIQTLELGSGGTVEIGLAFTGAINAWIRRSTDATGTSTNLLVYAISEPLTVQGNPAGTVLFVK